MALPVLSLVRGVPRGQSTLPLIYDQSTSVASPITAGTALTLPASGTYTLNSSSVANLQVYLNGDRMEQTFDWTTSGSGPNYTAIQFTFNLVAGDRVDFRIDRAS
jgi:hypothetical protein